MVRCGTLLTEFHKWASPVELRQKGHAAAVPALDTESYMLSKQGYGGDSIAHWPPHLMFYFSQTDPATWGANLPGSPIVASRDDGEQVTEFVVAVQRWSDGTEGR